VISILTLGINLNHLAYAGVSGGQDDPDNDGIFSTDNCPTVFNPPPAPGVPQVDTDGDGLGDACDICLDDPLNQCLASDGQSIGGELMPIDSTSLLIVGIHSNTSWLILVVFSIVGIGLILVRRK
jgi:hypothetical protein